MGNKHTKALERLLVKLQGVLVAPPSQGKVIFARDGQRYIPDLFIYREGGYYPLELGGMDIKKGIAFGEFYWVNPENLDQVIEVTVKTRTAFLLDAYPFSLDNHPSERPARKPTRSPSGRLTSIILGQTGAGPIEQASLVKQVADLTGRHNVYVRQLIGGLIKKNILNKTKDDVVSLTRNRRVRL